MWAYKGQNREKMEFGGMNCNKYSCYAPRNVFCIDEQCLVSLDVYRLEEKV